MCMAQSQLGECSFDLLIEFLLGIWRGPVPPLDWCSLLLKESLEKIHCKSANVRCMLAINDFPILQLDPQHLPVDAMCLICSTSCSTWKNHRWVANGITIAGVCNTFFMMRLVCRINSIPFMLEPALDWATIVLIQGYRWGCW